MRFPVPQSLYVRLTLSHFLVAVVSIGLVSVFAGGSIIRASQEQVEHHLEDLAFTASNILEEPLDEMLGGEASLAEVHNSIDYIFVENEGITYTLYLVDGTPLFRSDGTLPVRADTKKTPEVFTALQSELGEGDLIRPNEEGVDTLYVAVRIQHEDDTFGVLRLESPLKLAMSLTSVQRSLSLLLLSALFITLGVSVVGWLLARNLASPIEDLTLISERLRSGDLDARVKPAGPQELQLLAETFNGMANRVQGHMEELRVFVANASHELRTPLTSVKLRTEALRGGALKDTEVADRFLTEIEQEVDRLGKMVNDLLDLSRLEAGMESAHRAQVEIDLLLEEVNAIFRIRAERKGIKLEVLSDNNLPTVLANEEQLRRVFTNLLDNAVKNSSHSDQVQSRAQFEGVDKMISVTIADSGKGIADKHLHHIFERFYRVESTLPRARRMPGSGLGLAITKSIIELHGGSISVKSELGKGTTFHIKLPVI